MTKAQHPDQIGVFLVPDPELGATDKCPSCKQRHDHVAAVRVCIDNQGTTFGVWCYHCNKMQTAEEVASCDEEARAAGREARRAKDDPVLGYFKK